MKPAVLWILRASETDHPVPQLAELLRADGHAVRLLPWAEPAPGRKRAYTRRIVVDRSPGPRREPISVTAFSPALLRDLVQAPETIVIHRDLGSIAAFAGLARRMRPELRSIALLENHMADAGPAATAWFKRMPRRLCARGPNLVIANHERAAVQAREFGVPPDRISVGWWMAGLDPTAPELTRPTLQDGDRIELCSVGKLIGRKGNDLLLAAMAEAVASGANLGLTIVGKGEDAESLHAQTAALGLTGRVHFTGAVNHSEVRAVMVRSHVAVMPSLEDHTGRAAIEAVSMGLPAIVGKATGVAKILIDDGRNGLHVNPADTAAFARTLGSLSTPLISGMAAEARTDAAQLTSEAAARVVLNAIEAVS